MATQTCEMQKKKKHEINQQLITKTIRVSKPEIKQTNKQTKKDWINS